VRDGQPSPHRPRLVVSRSTCPPISPPHPHVNSFVLGPAVINTPEKTPHNTHTIQGSVQGSGNVQGVAVRPDWPGQGSGQGGGVRYWTGGGCPAPDSPVPDGGRDVRYRKIEQRWQPRLRSTRRSTLETPLPVGQHSCCIRLRASPRTGTIPQVQVGKQLRCA
jgi:hypothetical protein